MTRFSSLRWFRKPDPAEERRRSLAYIRESFAMFGHPLDHLSDEEIERGITESAAIFAQTGISADDFSDRLVELSKAMRLEP